MLIAILIAVGFYRSAKKRQMNAVLWAVLGLVGWIGGQFVAIFFMGLVDPNSIDLNDRTQVMIYGIVGAVIGTILVLIFFENVPQKAS